MYLNIMAIFISSRAIMRYHKLKMEEINKIIRELWIKTYRGGGTCIYTPVMGYVAVSTVIRLFFVVVLYRY